MAKRKERKEGKERKGKRTNFSPFITSSLLCGITALFNGLFVAGPGSERGEEEEEKNKIFSLLFFFLFFILFRSWRGEIITLETIFLLSFVCWQRQSHGVKLGTTKTESPFLKPWSATNVRDKDGAACPLQFYLSILTLSLNTLWPKWSSRLPTYLPTHPSSAQGGVKSDQNEE